MKHHTMKTYDGQLSRHCACLNICIKIISIFYTRTLENAKDNFPGKENGVGIFKRK
jgi:hypothetical protein